MKRSRLNVSTSETQMVGELWVMPDGSWITEGDLRFYAMPFDDVRVVG